MENFIKNLEQKLIISEVNFRDFDKELWFYLCGRKKTELKSLTKELGVKGKYLSDTNIGNIRIEVMNSLGINFMIQ